MKIINSFIFSFLFLFISCEDNYEKFNKLISTPPPLDDGIAITYGGVERIPVNPEILANDNINFLQNDMRASKEYLYVPADKAENEQMPFNEVSFNNTLFQNIVSNAKKYEEIVTAGDQKTMEQFIKQQEDDYQKYFDEINKLEFQKVYKALNPNSLGGVPQESINPLATNNLVNMVQNVPENQNELQNFIK
jgi:hypothetical protein